MHSGKKTNDTKSQKNKTDNLRRSFRLKCFGHMQLTLSDRSPKTLAKTETKLKVTKI